VADAVVKGLTRHCCYQPTFIRASVDGKFSDKMSTADGVDGSFDATSSSMLCDGTEPAATATLSDDPSQTDSGALHLDPVDSLSPTRRASRRQSGRASPNGNRPHGGPDAVANATEVAAGGLPALRRVPSSPIQGLILQPVPGGTFNPAEICQHFGLDMRTFHQAAVAPVLGSSSNGPNAPDELRSDDSPMQEANGAAANGAAANGAAANGAATDGAEDVAMADPTVDHVDGCVSGDLHLLGVDVDDRDSYEGVNEYMHDVVRAIADMLCSNYLGESDFDMQAETSAKPMLDTMVELAPTFRSDADRFLEAVPSLKESYADDDFYGGESFEVVRKCAEAFAGLRWGFTSEYDESSGGAGSGVATNGSVDGVNPTPYPRHLTAQHLLISHWHPSGGRPSV